MLRIKVQKYSRFFWMFRRMTPAVYPFWTWVNSKRFVKKHEVTLTDAWWGFVEALNTPRAYKYIKKHGSGWFDRQKKITVMGFCGNMVKIRRIVGNNKWGEVITLGFHGEPPDPQEVNYFKTPWLVHRFTVVRKDGKLFMPNCGDAFVPLISDVPPYAKMADLEVVETG